MPRRELQGPRIRSRARNTTVEQFAASTRGRLFAFDNKKGVKNQEIWFLDRNH